MYLKISKNVDHLFKRPVNVNIISLGTFLSRVLAQMKTCWLKFFSPALAWRCNTLQKLTIGVSTLASWSRHDKETILALLALCDGNPSVSGGFPSQRLRNVERRWFGVSFEQRAELIRDAMMFIRRYSMTASSNGIIFRITGPLCGEFTGHPVNSPHKGQWRGAWMFSFICGWTIGWTNNRDAGYLGRHRAHYDVTLMVMK